ncbi:hypothetical protein ACFLYY_02095 [Patescibacteria group bacterium]
MVRKVKEIIRVVTVTGADDSIMPEELISIAEDYPFVEFGILLSKNQQGGKRFPSREWLEELYILWLNEKIVLSGHLCGEWVRLLCLGMPNFFEEFGYGYLWKMFERFQLNFHAEPHRINEEKFSRIFKKYIDSKPIIFQIDGENNNIFHSMRTKRKTQAFPLFDLSGGAGVIPKEWPKQQLNQYCGYAGGLSPSNLKKEMERISKVTTDSIWIDAETLLRSENDMVFDLEKVRHFLEEAKPWVKYC